MNSGCCSSGRWRAKEMPPRLHVRDCLQPQITAPGFLRQTQLGHHLQHFDVRHEFFVGHRQTTFECERVADGETGCVLQNRNDRDDNFRR